MNSGSVAFSFLSTYCIAYIIVHVQVRTTLKGQCHENHLYHDSPAALNLVLSKLRKDIRRSRCTTGSVDTSGCGEKCPIFPKIYIDRDDNGGPLSTGVNNAGGKLPQVSTTPAENYVK